MGGTFFQYFQQGGPMMWPLLACSLLGLGLIIERGISNSRIKGDTAEIFSAIRQVLLKGDLRQSVKVCESYDHPVAATLKSGLLRFGKSHEEIAVSVVAELISVRRLARDMAQSWDAKPKKAAGGLEGVRELPAAEA